MKAVEVKNLSYSYDENTKVLNNVSFSIEEGKYVSLLGHNGSGKSTLAKILIGLFPLKDPEIYIFGDKLTKENLTKIRKKVGIVFQNPDNQFIASSVEDDIAFGLENRCLDPKEMKPLILHYAERVGMLDYLDKEPCYLSGGQKQRVAIAGVLVLSPSLIIFDEATSMLDPRGKREIREGIMEMRKHRPDITVLSITHDVEEAYLSDEVIILDKGEILASGPSKEILSNEEIMAKAKLTSPFLSSLKSKLSKAGFDVNDCHSLEEVSKKLCR